MANGCAYGHYLGSDGRCHYSPWNSWGRWILAGVFLFFAAIFAWLWMRRMRNARRLAHQQGQWGGGSAQTPLRTMPPPQYGGYAPPPGNNNYDNSPYGGGYPPQPPPPPPPAYGTKPGVEEGVATPASVYPHTPLGENYAPPGGPPPGKY